MMQTLKDIIIGAVMGLLVAIFLFCSICEAKEVGTTFGNQDGGIYISALGWAHVDGGLYYSHKTNSRMYGRHEVCRNTYRWKGTKLYYFGDDGKAITKNEEYIELNRDGSVKYIYIPQTNKRYSTASRRYQLRYNGQWNDVGNQTSIWWMCDWQE